MSIWIGAFEVAASFSSLLWPKMLVSLSEITAICAGTSAGTEWENQDRRHG